MGTKRMRRQWVDPPGNRHRLIVPEVIEIRDRIVAQNKRLNLGPSEGDVMKFEFTFRHMDSSVALQNFTKKKIRQEAEKFERKPLSVHVTFDRQGPEQIAHCLVVGPGLDVTVEHSSEDLYAAVDGLAHKLKRQLSRLKSKKVSHHSEQFAHHNLKLA